MNYYSAVILCAGSPVCGERTRLRRNDGEGNGHIGQQAGGLAGSSRTGCRGGEAGRTGAGAAWARPAAAAVRIQAAIAWR